MARDLCNRMLATEIVAMQAMVHTAWPGSNEAHARFNKMLKRLQG